MNFGVGRLVYGSAQSNMAAVPRKVWSFPTKYLVPGSSVQLQLQMGIVTL